MNVRKFITDPRHKTLNILIFALASFSVCLGLETWYRNEITGKEDLYTLNNFSSKYFRFGFKIPRDLNIAGEPCPVNDKKFIQRFQEEIAKQRIHLPQYRIFDQRMRRWFPVIEPILKENGIPEDLKYIALIESNLTNSTSPRGARGFWQFVESSAKQFGLKVDEEVDQRLDVELSTRAACKYLKEAYQTLGSWTLAAAAYNLGIEGVASRVKDQKSNNYFEMKFNPETARYLFKFLAVKELHSRPEQYGVLPPKVATPAPIRVNKLIIDYPIANLDSFAKDQGISYAILQYFNPWINGNTLNPDENQKFLVTIPDRKYPLEFLENLANSDADRKNASPENIPDSVKIGNFAGRDSNQKPIENNSQGRGIY